MKTIGFLGDNPQQQMKDGTETKALYVKHMAKADWQIIEELKAVNQMSSAADVVRWAIRKAAGRI